MKQHFVTFYSPGTFVAEATEKPIESWDTDTALAMMEDIKERHGATPYGFRFSTRARGETELDSKEVALSGMYYVGGKVRTREEVEADNLPGESILRGNMRCNDYERIWQSTEGWAWSQPLRPDDTVLAPPDRAALRAGGAL